MEDLARTSQREAVVVEDLSDRYEGAKRRPVAHSARMLVILASVFGASTARGSAPDSAVVDGPAKTEVVTASVVRDDPKLPRYLSIGDSISGGYRNGLGKALEGKFNVHHRSTRSSGEGKINIAKWLGANGQPGRHWDVISFNFGHWDADRDRATYQGNLEAVIQELKKTGAKLIWVTTCPVPLGFSPAGELTPEGRAQRQTSGVSKKYLNSWALEVIGRHPEISVCDLWQFVVDDQDGVYKEWWAGKDIHFGREAADAQGRYLAAHVERVMATTK